MEVSAGESHMGWLLYGLLYGGLALVAMIVGELAFYPIQRFLVDRDRITDPLWIRAIRALILLAVGCAVVVIGIYLNGKL